MEYSKFKTLLRRVIVIPMAVTAALAVLLMWESFDLNQSMQLVEHTDQVLDQSARLLKLLVDVETGMRGYLATGDESLLRPFRKARSDSIPNTRPCPSWLMTALHKSSGWVTCVPAMWRG